MAETKTYRTCASFKDLISEDSDKFQPEVGRYHMYIAYSCPLAHRANIAYKLKGLEDVIGLSILHPTYQKDWPEVDEHYSYVFKKPDDAPLKNANGFGSYSCEGCIPDTVNNAHSLRQIYAASGCDQQPVYPVPVLYDKKLKCIVNTDSSDVLRMFNTVFNKWAKHPEVDLYPEHLRKEIDETNEWVVNHIANGPIACGFTYDQTKYEAAVENVFKNLDRAEEVLSKNRFLVGNQFTEADIKLFVGLLRFDECYTIFFKCNIKRITDYPNLLNFCREVYQMPRIAETVNMRHIKTFYSSSDSKINFYGVIPYGEGFLEKLKEKHNRDEVFPAHHHHHHHKH